MIEKLNGRDKVVWLTVANKVNELIDEIEKIKQILEKSVKNEEETNESNIHEQGTS